MAREQERSVMSKRNGRALYEVILVSKTDKNQGELVFATQESRENAENYGRCHARYRGWDPEDFRITVRKASKAGAQSYIHELESKLSFVREVAS